MIKFCFNRFTRATLFFFVVVFLFSSSSNGQDLRAIADSILEEGRMLYHIELADRNSELELNQKYSKEEVKHRLSYTDGRSIYTLFFTEKGKHVRFEFTYPGLTKPSEYEIAGTKRKPSKLEKRLFKCLVKTENAIATDTTFIKPFPNFSHRKIFVVQHGKITGYVFPNSILKHVVPFGNDFQFHFSRKGKLKSIDKQHTKFLLVESNPQLEDDEQVVSGAHGHSNNYSPFMTATDVCTLLLYKQYLAWNQHVVVHDRYVSFFDLTRESLDIYPASEVEGVAQPEEK